MTIKPARMTIAAALLTAAVLTVSLGTAAAASGSATPRAAARQIARGKAIAETRCAACHGVSANTASPNPESPPFEDVVNKPGLTQRTLQRFLSDSHNYPAAMNFTMRRQQSADLAAYMLTLRRADHKPSI